MPDIKILPPKRINPYAYDNSKAVMSIMQILGSAEAARRKKIMTENILGALSKGREGISSAALMEPGFSGGIPGALQRFASPFAARTPGIEDIIAGRGIERAFDTLSPSQMIASERLYKYQTTGDEKWISPSMVNINTGQKLLTEEQRQKIAETEFKAKVSLSPAEKNLARKSAEEILKGTRARFWHWGTEDYTQEMMLDNYKSWMAENSYEEQTLKKQKDLDDIWDAKMTLWQKSGIKFDKDNIIGKGEIAWDPNDPEVKKLREKSPEQSPTGTQQLTPTMQQLPPTGTMKPSTLQPTRAALLAEYRRLGGSRSAAARKFAEDNGLLE